MSGEISVPRAGLTLIEMVLVLVILTAVATIAVEMVEPQVNQTRFESTQTSLSNVRKSIIGPENQIAADGSVAVSGFMADVGRSPFLLDELWSNPTALPAFAPQNPAGDTEVVLSAGWNGPYLQLPIGGTTLTDAWGMPFDVHLEDGTASTLTDPIHIVRSRGRDGVALGGTGYDGDIDLALSATSNAVAAGLTSTSVNHIEKSLTVYVYYQDNSQNPISGQGTEVIVRIYGPNSGTVETIAADDDQPDASGSKPITFTFTDVPIGTKIIRAYQTNTLPADDEDTVSLASDNSVSAPQRVIISRHASSTQLILNDVP